MDYIDEDFDSLDCPVCTGYSFYLGQLGKWQYFQCRYCGYEFAEKTELEDVN